MMCTEFITLSKLKVHPLKYSNCERLATKAEDLRMVPHIVRIQPILGLRQGFKQRSRSTLYCLRSPLWAFCW